MRNKLAVVAITLAVALLFSTTPAKAGKPTTIVTPFNSVLTNSCTGEDVSVTGTQTASFDTEIKNGIAHSRIHLVADLDGVGVMSGNNYSVHQVTNQTLNLKIGPPNTGENNFIQVFRFISQGGDDNLHVRINSHFTINANGDVTVDRIDAELECVG